MFLMYNSLGFFFMAAGLPKLIFGKYLDLVSDCSVLYNSHFEKRQQPKIVFVVQTRNAEQRRNKESLAQKDFRGEKSIS